MNRRFESVVIACFLIGILFISLEFFSGDEISVYAQVGTSVGGYMSANTTWTSSGSPYIVEETVIVEPNVALSIDPGVEVRFASGSELIIDGALIASGNSGNFITFTSNSTSPQAGDWGAIRFMETSDDDSCIINWAIIRYASTGVYAYGSSPEVKNSKIEYNANFGIYSTSVSIFIDDLGVPVIENCIVTDNGGVPIDVDRQGGIYVKFGGIDIQNSLVANSLGHGILSVASDADAVLANGITIRNSTGTGVEGKITILNSTITENNLSGIRSTGSIHFNSIFGNTPYDLVCDNDPLDASNNWWGSTNETVIEENIYDYYDDFNLGIVTFKPYISSPYFVYYDEQVYDVGVLSNSSITNFEFSQSEKSISFSVNGTDGTTGFCNVSIPADLMWGDFSLYLNDAALVEGVDYTETYNGTHYLFSIDYVHSGHILELFSTEVVPDFAACLFMPFLMSATLLGLALRKRLKEQRPI
jgi:hypothetical protein